jgi:hypothetical protein
MSYDDLIGIANRNYEAAWAAQVLAVTLSAAAFALLVLLALAVVVLAAVWGDRDRLRRDLEGRMAAEREVGRIEEIGEAARCNARRVADETLARMQAAAREAP